jgi:hypothetical protein
MHTTYAFRARVILGVALPSLALVVRAPADLVLTTLPATLGVGLPPSLGCAVPPLLVDLLGVGPGPGAVTPSSVVSLAAVPSRALRLLLAFFGVGRNSSMSSSSRARDTDRVIRKRAPVPGAAEVARMGEVGASKEPGMASGDG